MYLDYSQDLQTRSNSETSLVSSNLGSNQLDFFNDDTECLIQSGGNSPSRLKAVSQIGVGGRRLSSAVATNKTFGGSLFSLPQPTLEPGVFRSLNYPAFQSLRIEKVSKLIDNPPYAILVLCVCMDYEQITSQISGKKYIYPF